jgi:hypothetical protein
MAEGDQPLFPIKNRSVAEGVNTRVFPLDIKDTEAVELQNIDSSTAGQRQKRQGFTICATGITAGPILALSEFTDSATQSTMLLAVSPGLSAGDHKRLWSWDGQATQFVNRGSLLGYTASPFTEDGQIQIVNGYDLDRGTLEGQPFVAVINTQQEGVDRWAFDGNSLYTCHYGAASGEPQGIPMAFVQNRAFGRGGKTNQQDSELYFSDILQSWTFTAAGSIGFGSLSVVFGADTKQEIRGAQLFRNNELIVWQSDATEELILTNSALFSAAGAAAQFANWERRAIDPTIGLASHKSVATVGQDIYFADQYGNIRSIARTIQDANQGTKSLPISEPLDSWIKRINPSASYNIVGQSFDRWYVLGLPIDNATEPDHVFLLDVARSAAFQRAVWDGPWIGVNPFSMARATIPDATDSADQNPTLYVGRTTTASGEVVRMFRGSDDAGTDVEYREVSKRYDWGNLELNKQGARMELFAVATATATLHVEANTDAMGWQTVGYLNLIGDAPMLPEDLPFNFGGVGVARSTIALDSLNKFRDLQIRMTATTDQQVKVLGYTLYAHIDNYDWQVSEDSL